MRRMLNYVHVDDFISEATYAPTRITPRPCCPMCSPPAALPAAGSGRSVRGGSARDRSVSGGIDDAATALHALRLSKYRSAPRRAAMRLYAQHKILDGSQRLHSSLGPMVWCILDPILPSGNLVYTHHMLKNLQRPNFYRYVREACSLDDYLREQMTDRLARLRTGMLDERNVQSYQHGTRWALEASSAGESEMRSMAAESTLHTIDIINHETTVIESYIETIVEQFYSSLMEHLFQTAGDAANSAGNNISRNEHGGNISAGFLAMLERIEFGVDRHGRATRPSMHVAPATGKNFLEALKSQPAEYHLKVEMLSIEKEKKAIAREVERISKFRWRRP